MIATMGACILRQALPAVNQEMRMSMRALRICPPHARMLQWPPAQRRCSNR